jgi:glycerol uptake facilitator-like aquaporin
MRGRGHWRMYTPATRLLRHPTSSSLLLDCPACLPNLSSVMPARRLTYADQRQSQRVLSGGLAANGHGVHSPGGYALYPAIVVEIVLSFMFLMIILGATDARAPQGFAPIAIGLALTLIHLISIPVTNTSVNPARRTGPAVFVGGWAISQPWLFWAAPIVGAIIAGFVIRHWRVRRQKFQR